MTEQLFPKSNNKSNSAASVQSMIENTEKNIREAEISMEFASGEELENLQEKNQRRNKELYVKKKEMQDKVEAEAESRKNQL
ncbi:small acid-soluble spore protein Tlp [Viridibacillus arvi]|uniref:small acid-soluble spore protein Tlp n=1 Tax=Viridibacillus arvi TaxID=263475 RepID=UPI00187B2ED9|nr:small acid-soluble spore protein Tlp [Viridibacillus sp. JNUCC-6]QOV12181.1 small acid-soluble spore protein Tlp [Viridibacillus sp. JNUCC-6]